MKQNLSDRTARMSSDERGFTMIEALIAIGIFVLTAFAGLAACKTIAGVLNSSIGSNRGAELVERQAAQMRNDAASAFAVFVAPDDIFGRPNRGQEVDFFTKTDDGRGLYWCYSYDAGAQTLRRWDFDATGAHGVRDGKSGAIDSAAAYPPLEHVTVFTATALAADALGDEQRNMYGGMGALFAHTPHAYTVPLAAAGFGLPPVAGGNGVVDVLLANAATSRRVHLLAGSVPSGFTVTGVPVWHAIVYRLDQSHRFLLGPAEKSHVFINARVDVSYDRWATSKRWCDFNLLGAPHGLDGHDPHADYKPDEPIEQADTILAACRKQIPLPPSPEASDYPPDPSAVHSPLPGQTAPPCWTHPGPAGRCWPSDAPVDWVPPSPLPADTPPPAWCSTHAASVACGAPRATAGIR